MNYWLTEQSLSISIFNISGNLFGSKGYIKFEIAFFSRIVCVSFDLNGEKFLTLY